MCRAYLATVASAGGRESAFLLPLVPASLATIIANITAAIERARIPQCISQCIMPYVQCLNLLFCKP